jgi:hypothetical protein
MKRLSLIDLHNAEIRKNQMAKIKGGSEIRCQCSLQYPYFSLKQTAPGGNLCLCSTSTNNSANVQQK